MSSNPWEWPLQPAPRSMWINGYTGLFYSSFGWTLPTQGVALIPTATGTHVQQRRLGGLTKPASVRPWEKTLILLPASEESHQALEAAAHRGAAVDLFAGWTLTDIWDAVAGQTEFSFSRPPAYEAGVVLAGEGEVTPSTHPVRAFINDAELMPEDILYEADPSPGAGQVGIVLGDHKQNRAVRTAALSAADELRVIYPPLHAVTVDPSYQTGGPGELSHSYRLTEAILGTWD